MSSSAVRVSEAFRIAIFDLNFESPPRVDELARRSGVAHAREKESLRARSDAECPSGGVSGLWTAYARSYDWLFYGARHGVHEPDVMAGGTDERLPQTLPGLQRFILVDEGEAAAELPLGGESTLPPRGCGCSVLIDARRHVGVASFWFHAAWCGSPATLSQALAFKTLPILEFETVVRRLAPFVTVAGQERQHTVMAIRLASPDTPQEAVDRCGPDVARLLTGSDEFTDEYWLRQYVDAAESASRRSYERMFVRWTDTLLLYNREVGKQDMTSYEDELRTSIARATQVIEQCVLVRRLLRNFNREIERRSARHVLLPWRVRRKLLRPFFEIERRYRIAPPFRTVEGEHLVTTSFRRFGVEQLFESARAASEFLERRLDAAQTEWALAIAAIAIVASVVVELAPW